MDKNRFEKSAAKKMDKNRFEISAAKYIYIKKYN